MIEINGGIVRGTPVLAAAGGDNAHKLERLTYAAKSKSGVYYLPAFPPFLSVVLEDLTAIFGSQVTFTDQAQTMIERGRKEEDLYTKKYLDPEFKFKTSPYDHQRETFLYLLYHPRSLALLDPGLGKTKVACDGISYLKKKALIVVPAFLVSNWVDEISTHYSGDVVVKAVTGKSEKRRAEALGIARKYKQELVFNEDGTPKLTKSGAQSKKKVLVSETFSKIDADILVCGYEVAAINKEQIYKNFDYDMLVLDEVHKCKGHKAKRTIAIGELAQKCHYRWGLSGTVDLGDPRDLYSQLNILSPMILDQDYWAFCRAHLIKATWNDHVVVGYKNLQVLNRKIRKHSIRYLVDDCLDLPSRRILTRKVEMSEEQIQLTEDLASDDDLHIDGGNVPKEHKIVAIGKLSQVTGGFMYLSTKDIKICDGCPHVFSCIEAKPVVKAYTKRCKIVQKAPPSITKYLKENPKIEMLDSLLDEILPDLTTEGKKLKDTDFESSKTDPNKIIIWCRYEAEIKMISDLLEKKKIGYVRIGATPSEQAKILDEDPEIRVMLGNIGMGVGFTANAANYMIYYSISYKLEDWLQSIARNRRINQKRKQTVYVLTGKGTIDEQIMMAIERKEDIVEYLLSNLNCFTCKHRYTCALKGIKQYDEGCILSTKVLLNRVDIKKD